MIYLTQVCLFFSHWEKLVLYMTLYQVYHKHKNTYLVQISIERKLNSSMITFLYLGGLKSKEFRLESFDSAQIWISIYFLLHILLFWLCFYYLFIFQVTCIVSSFGFCEASIFTMTRRELITQAECFSCVFYTYRNDIMLKTNRQYEKSFYVLRITIWSLENFLC